MKQEKIFAVIKKASGGVEIRLIEKEPKTYSGLVEGKRELIPFPSMAGVCIVFDGEADKSQKKPNCFLPEYNDLLFGTVAVVGINIETGFTSLTEEQAGKVEEYLKTNDAKTFNGDIADKVAAGYVPPSEENTLLSMLSEVKTKHKAMKFNWLKKR